LRLDNWIHFVQFSFYPLRGMIDALIIHSKSWIFRGPMIIGDPGKRVNIPVKGKFDNSPKPRSIKKAGSSWPCQAKCQSLGSRSAFELP
jgi:hypothetical protein